MRYGSLELSAYKRIDGVEMACDLAACVLTVRNGTHLFGSPSRIPTYKEDDGRGVYAYMPWAISETDDLEILVTNTEEEPVEVTVYMFFYNASGNPIGTGFASTIRQHCTSRCSIREQIA
jgi:hypothetical protein